MQSLLMKSIYRLFLSVLLIVVGLQISAPSARAQDSDLMILTVTQLAGGQCVSRWRD